MKTYIATFKDDKGNMWEFLPLAENLAKAKAKALAQADKEKDQHKLAFVNIKLAVYELYVLNHHTGKEEHVAYYMKRNENYAKQVFQLKISRGSHEEIRWRVIPNKQRIK